MTTIFATTPLQKKKTKKKQSDLLLNIHAVLPPRKRKRKQSDVCEHAILWEEKNQSDVCEHLDLQNKTHTYIHTMMFVNIHVGVPKKEKEKKE
jgi:hypothetical protein